MTKQKKPIKPIKLKPVQKQIDKVVNETIESIGDNLNEKQKQFCREYIFDWNATRSYKAVYTNVKDDNVAAAASSRLLTNVKISTYLSDIQKDIAKIAGISRLRVAKEYEKLAFSSIADLHNTWIERKDFESLMPEQKACIQEIETKTITRNYNDEVHEIEYVKIKLYDKKGSLDSLAKMLGLNEPDKIDFNRTDDIDLSQLTDEELIEFSKLSSKIKKPAD
jgi:phage terminase small subunit